MRIIAANTIRKYWEEHPKSEQSLKAWLQEVENSDWKSPQELKQKYRHASIITGKRVVFNIGGNNFRLIVDVEFRLKIVFIVWFGTHSQYDIIDAKTVSYAKTDKK